MTLYNVSICHQTFLINFLAPELVNNNHKQYQKCSCWI